MLWGFRSLWVTPLSWTSAMAKAMPIAMGRKRSMAIGAPSRPSSESPPKSSRTRAGIPWYVSRASGRTTAVVSSHRPTSYSRFNCSRSFGLLRRGSSTLRTTGSWSASRSARYRVALRPEESLSTMV
jgi:hypothetical protein